MNADGQRQPAYMHGIGPAEQDRLEMQAKLLGGSEFLPSLQPGMRIVEFGCGTGAMAGAEIATALAVVKREILAAFERRKSEMVEKAVVA